MRGSISTKSVLGSQKTIKTIFGHVRYLIFFLIIFLPSTKINYTARYKPKSLQFGQLDQFGGRFGIYECGRLWVKIQLCSNLREEVLRGQKRKNCSFLSQSIENPQSYNMSKNQPSRSIRMGDMKSSSLFNPENSCSSPIIPSELS